MQSLAVKYRPRTFNDVVEQGNIKSILEEQLATKTFKHCYLFTGGAGTGKTTCARIFAQELNGHKGSPIEIDAASNNGVENVREIIDNSKFKALDAPYKVYIIDECHMLSIGAWNAMLKLLEEPPAATMFILCTTDPQKIPATILSRVQRYDFQRITFKSIVERLQLIVNAENEDIECDCAGHAEEQGADLLFAEQEALEYIAKLADGGMRDAITLLDKCISYSNDVTMENVVAALGTINYQVMLDLTNAVLDRKAAEAVQIIEEAHRSGVDLKQFIKQYSNFVLDLCKYELLGGFEYLQIPSTLESQLADYGEDDYSFFQDLLKSMIELSGNIKWETAPKPLIESTFILLCA
jgi:DNA polymerase-3 subunit gamma/tau